MQTDPAETFIDTLHHTVIADDRALFIVGNDHPRALVMVEWRKQPVKGAELNKITILFHKSNLSADRFLFLFRQLARIEFITECAEIGDVGPCG